MNFKRFSRVLMALTVMMLCTSLTGAPALAADKRPVDYLDSKPLVDVLQSTTLKPVQAGNLRVPVITWPGDVATVHTLQSGVFKAEGLSDVELFCENDFVTQVQGVINGKTPILRGTMGMINTALPAFTKAGTGLVVVVQLTWSVGGDCMVVRDANIKKLEDLKGKTIALQQYGPHVDLVTTILETSGLKPTDVKLKWLKELTVPEKSGGKIVDPRTAFWATPGIDVCMVISPDAAELTSGGAESSVKGAKVLFSTKTASHVIADVYAIRKDYFDSHRDEMQKFVHALLLGEESFRNLRANKASNKKSYDELMKESAKLLFGSAIPQNIKNVNDSLGDCEWVGYSGNVGFFTGAGTKRTLGVLTNEIQGAFIDLKLMDKRLDLDQADWDYSKLAVGLKNVTAVAKPVFDADKVRTTAQKEMNTELETWEQDSLLAFEIYFEPNQYDFAIAKYESDFAKALKMVQTMGGALISIEGHNNADKVNKLKKSGAKPSVIDNEEQGAINASKMRAEAVRQSFLDYCKTLNVVVDESQFLAEGIGNKSQKYPKPHNAQQWSENRRVVFRIKQRETELNTFEPEADAAGTNTTK